MERPVYAIEADIEERHWWFAGRRRLFASELRRAGMSSNAHVLDIGTGTGSNLRMLRELGIQHVVGLDNGEDAIRFCREKGLGLVVYGDIRAIPFPDCSFDFILATDVIEHIEDDARALLEIARVLRPGGKVLLAVPAFRMLWGLQDRVALHKRRYRMAPLRRHVEAAGLQSVRSFHFNYLLFLPILLARRLMGLTERLGVEFESEGQINTPLLNKICSAIFACDIRTAPILHPPFGVSILVIAQK